MTIRPITEAPNPYNGTYNPPAEMLYADGYRIAPPIPEPAEGYTRIAQPVLVDVDGINGEWDMTGCDRLTSEIEAEQAAATLAANAERWALENRYITLCDTLRTALSQPATQTKLGFEELEPMMVALKAANASAYQDLYDGMNMINLALIRFDVRWWDTCVWHPEVVQ